MPPLGCRSDAALQPTANVATNVTDHARSELDERRSVFFASAEFDPEHRNAKPRGKLAGGDQVVVALVGRQSGDLFNAPIEVMASSAGL
jgi:hypothetical protein